MTSFDLCSRLLEPVTTKIRPTGDSAGVHSSQLFHVLIAQTAPHYLITQERRVPDDEFRFRPFRFLGVLRVGQIEDRIHQPDALDGLQYGIVRRIEPVEFHPLQVADPDHERERPTPRGRRPDRPPPRGAQQCIVRGLLTRAWLRFVLGDADGARAELDEAWAIAARGPMPLFMAEIHLHRARLLRDQDALAVAQHLIARHAYHRRNPELAHARAASEADAENKVLTGDHDG